MFKKNHLVIFLGGFLFLIDQLLKYLAVHQQNFSFYLVKPYLGWEYFPNPGIAFSIPFPNLWLVLLTPPIIIFLLYYWKKQEKLSPTTQLGLTLIVTGALSNLIDRIFFHVTIDYLHILTAVINLADAAIFAGTMLLIFCHKNTKNRTT